MINEGMSITWPSRHDLLLFYISPDETYAAAAG